MRRQAFAMWSIFGLIIFGWVLLILLTPFAASRDLTSVSGSLYNFFGFFCHQIPERSLHFENHAFAVCSRCFGIYFGLLAGFVAYPFFCSVEDVEPPRRVWLFAAMIPMAVDWSLGYFGFWANTHLTRFLTGATLGTVCAVFLIPALIELRWLYFNRKN